MSGTKEGSRKAVATIYKEYGREFFREAGARGGRKSRNGGFAAYITCHCKSVKGPHHNAMCAGARGGRISRRRAKTSSEA